MDTALYISPRMAVSLIIITVQQIGVAIGVGLVSVAAAAVILFIGDSLTEGIVSYRYALLVSEELVIISTFLAIYLIRRHARREEPELSVTH